ncbi:hypothetical protein FJZ53_05385 [Candidatus Woesearchaeota archaeon]|nr:hypothetical protein [Candidatus Woesearchaeota archaeon]
MKRIVLSFLMIFLLSNLVYAQAELPDSGILPDSAFYGMKKTFEGIGNIFAFSAEAKAERALKLAEKRLAEAEAMANKGKPDFVDGLSQEYENKVNEANEIATLAKEAQDREKLAELVSTATSQHIIVLDEVQEIVPEQAKERIAAARERSIRGNQEALKALARENPEKAAEVAMGVAESRANKAKQASDEGDEEKAGEAAEEYEKYARFGDEISSIAQQVGKDPSKVNELVATATSLHITVLEDVLKKVPEQAKSSIQRVIEQSKMGRDSVVGPLEERGLPIPDVARGRPADVPAGEEADAEEREQEAGEAGAPTTGASSETPRGRP